MVTLIVDGRANELAHQRLPDNVKVEVIDLAERQIRSDGFVDPPMLAATSLAGYTQKFWAALAGSTHGLLAAVELDFKHPARPVQPLGKKCLSRRFERNGK